MVSLSSSPARRRKAHDSQLVKGILALHIAEQVAQDAFYVLIEVIAFISHPSSITVLESSLSSSSKMQNSPELWFACR